MVYGGFVGDVAARVSDAILRGFRRPDCGF